MVLTIGVALIFKVISTP